MSRKATHVNVGNLASAVGSLFSPMTIPVRPPTLRGERYRAPKARGRLPLADVYLPHGPGPHPSIVLVHGGGFVIGSRGMKPMRYLATRLCEAGLAVATFDYRRLFRGGNLERSVDDVQVMLRWWAAQSARFDLDPTRVTTAGLSAGATLMLLATAGEPPIPLSHVISVFALYDLSGIRGVVPRILGRALVGRRNPEEWQRRSPLRAPFCSAPLTMLHGTADKLTPIQQAYDYAALRREAGLSTTLHVYDGARHGFFNDDRKPVADKAFADLLEAAWARSGQVAGQAALVGHQTRRTAHTL